MDQLPVPGVTRGAFLFVAATHVLPALIVVAGGRELISSSDSFLERLVAVALEHELPAPPKMSISGCGFRGKSPANPR